MAHAVHTDSDAEIFKENGETVVYENIRHTTESEDGSLSVEVVSEIGSVDAELYQRYARPFAYGHEDIRHHFAAWRRPLEGGGVEQGIRVTSQVTGAAAPPTYEQAQWIHPDLLALAESEATDDLVRVTLRLRGFPDWDIPIRPDSITVGAMELANALEAEETAIAARQALMTEMAGELSEAILAAGGEVIGMTWETGWLVADLPGSALGAILERSDVQTAIPDGALGGSLALGRTDLRPTEVVGVQPYWDASQFGDEPSPDMHSNGAITVAVIESGPVKDEASAFCTSSSCTATKFVSRYRCDQPAPFECTTVSSYDASLEHYDIGATDHATTVATTVVADYMDNQPMGGTFDRPAATSDAREAKLIHLGVLGGWHGRPGDAVRVFEQALLHALWDRADIITGGTMIPFAPNWIPDSANPCVLPSVCNIQAVYSHQMMAENAFDNQAFIVIAPSNSCGPLRSDCSVDTPANLPKVFTVNGIMGGPGCATDYRLCPLDICPPASCGLSPWGNSARGGADARIGSTTFDDAVSTIDLAVPQGITHLTQCAAPGNSYCQSTGYLVQTAGDSGTSFAAPRLAGLAALVKDYFMDTMQRWFSAPGWLHVYMLGQGDAHRSTNPADPAVPTTRASTGADMFYGMGRVKMRHPDMFGTYLDDFRSISFSTTTPYAFFVDNAPLPAAAEIVKCVLAQHEDMSHKPDVGLVRLEMWLRPPVGGRCLMSSDPQGYLADSSFDLSKMTAFRASNGQVGGKCAHVKVTPLVLPSQGPIWTQLFCYAADVEDDAPN